MTDTAAPPAAAAEAPAKKGGKKKIIMIVGAVLVLGLAAKFTVLKPAPDPDSEAAKPKGGELVTVEEMSINLADGHYLQVGVAIELAEGHPAKEFEKKGATAKMRDLVITTASARSMSELATPEGRDAFKEQLRAGGKELYPEAFYNVYLTDLVMQ